MPSRAVGLGLESRFVQTQKPRCAARLFPKTKEIRAATPLLVRFLVGNPTKLTYFDINFHKIRNSKKSIRELTTAIFFSVHRALTKVNGAKTGTNLAILLQNYAI